MLGGPAPRHDQSVRHAPALHRRPAGRVGVQPRTPRCSASSTPATIGVGGDDARAVAGSVVDVDHGVVQPADVGHDRQRAVAHRLHLGEAARLEAARHQQQVAAGEQPVGEALVVALDGTRPVRVARRRPRRSASASACVAVAEHRELGRQAVEQVERRAATRSTPFCSTSRVTITTSGPSVSAQAELVAAPRGAAAALPREVAAVVAARAGAGRSAGSHTVVSIPLRMPTSRSPRAAQHVVEPEARRPR